mgnify:FL=1
MQREFPVRMLRLYMLEYFVNPFVVMGLFLFSLILLILVLVSLVKIHKLQKKYDVFMRGKNAKSLEESLVFRMDQADELVEANAANERNIKNLSDKAAVTFQKYGLIKYNALDQMGGKLSFSLAMLTREDNGFIINVVHSREGCYSYIKEIIDGRSITTLGKEEAEALRKALGKEGEKSA